MQLKPSICGTHKKVSKEFALSGCRFSLIQYFTHSWIYNGYKIQICFYKKQGTRNRGEAELCPECIWPSDLIYSWFVRWVLVNNHLVTFIDLVRLLKCGFELWTWWRWSHHPHLQKKLNTFIIAMSYNNYIFIHIQTSQQREVLTSCTRTFTI